VKQRPNALIWVIDGSACLLIAGLSLTGNGCPVVPVVMVAVLGCGCLVMAYIEWRGGR